jgi:hypothetical protein
VRFSHSCRGEKIFSIIRNARDAAGKKLRRPFIFITNISRNATRHV